MPSFLPSAWRSPLIFACLLIAAPETLRADATPAAESRPPAAREIPAPTGACRGAFERRALDLRVEDFTFPVERIALYESQVESRAEVRLRAHGIEPRRSSAPTACQLRVSVVGDFATLRVDLAFGDPRAPAYTSTESVVSPDAAADASRLQSATALAVLAAIDRQIDRFVASLGAAPPFAAAR